LGVREHPYEQGELMKLRCQRIDLGSFHEKSVTDDSYPPAGVPDRRCIRGSEVGRVGGLGEARSTRPRPGENIGIVRIATVTETDLPVLLPLMRAYCDFYRATPPDDALLALSRSLLDDPVREGLQLVARIDGGGVVGFATIYWSWSTVRASRIAIMNDLFVITEARQSGVGGALIEACRARAAEHGATELVWQTAKDNFVAQALYERVGGRREEWIDYWLPIGA
jgi:GNAT superfamily N-acetyltransferase